MMERLINIIKEPANRKHESLIADAFSESISIDLNNKIFPLFFAKVILPSLVVTNPHQFFIEPGEAITNPQPVSFASSEDIQTLFDYFTRKTPEIEFCESIWITLNKPNMFINIYGGNFDESIIRGGDIRIMIAPGTEVDLVQGIFMTEKALYPPLRLQKVTYRRKNDDYCLVVFPFAIYGYIHINSQIQLNINWRYEFIKRIVSFIISLSTEKRMIELTHGLKRMGLYDDSGSPEFFFEPKVVPISVGYADISHIRHQSFYDLATYFLTEFRNSEVGLDCCLVMMVLISELIVDSFSFCMTVWDCIMSDSSYMRAQRSAVQNFPDRYYPLKETLECYRKCEVSTAKLLPRLVDHYRSQLFPKDASDRKRWIEVGVFLDIYFPDRMKSDIGTTFSESFEIYREFLRGRAFVAPEDRESHEFNVSIIADYYVSFWRFWLQSPREKSWDRNYPIPESSDFQVIGCELGKGFPQSFAEYFPKIFLTFGGGIVNKYHKTIDQPLPHFWFTERLRPVHSLPYDQIDFERICEILFNLGSNGYKINFESGVFLPELWSVFGVNAKNQICFNDFSVVGDATDERKPIMAFAQKKNIQVNFEDVIIDLDIAPHFMLAVFYICGANLINKHLPIDYPELEDNFRETLQEIFLQRGYFRFDDEERPSTMVNLGEYERITIPLALEDPPGFFARVAYYNKKRDERNELLSDSVYIVPNIDDDYSESESSSQERGRYDSDESGSEEPPEMD